MFCSFNNLYKITPTIFKVWLSLLRSLFLDTSPCNAHTTASDALWMGVPVVTLTGSTFAGSADLGELKAQLERDRLVFPLFDTIAYCRQLEKAFEEIWDRHARGASPETIFV